MQPTIDTLYQEYREFHRKLSEKKHELTSNIIEQTCPSVLEILVQSNNADIRKEIRDRLRILGRLHTL